ncbi:MAG: hypothetical protein V3U92_01955 [Cellulophaga sp.]
MNKKNLLLIFMLISVFGYSQTTVTLEDQCDCEVLSGVDVTAAGLTTPTGAETGDIYVNTNTGTIYYWDGDSWELTSSDNQRVLDFRFDSSTNELTLEIENGGAATVVVLPTEKLTTLTLNGNSLEYLDEDNQLTTIPLNVGGLALGADGNSLDYTDGAGSLTNIPLNVGSLVFNATTRELTYTNELGVSTALSLPSDSVTTLSTTDGTTYTYISEDNTSTSFDGTDNQDATQVNLNAALDIDGDGTNETTVQEAIAKLNTGSTDNQQLNNTNTLFNTVNGELTIALEDGGTATADLSTLQNQNTDNQDATQVNLNAALDIDGDGTNETTVQEAIEKLNTGSTDNQDLSISGNVLSLTGDGTTVTLPTADGSETVVNGGGINVVSGSGTTGSPYVVTGTEIDGSITNEIQTITSTDGSVTLTQTGDDYNLSVAAADGTETAVTAGANVTVSGDGSTATPYVVGVTSLDDGDANPTNEIQDLSISGNVLSLTGDGTTVTLPTADGSETVVNGAGINVVSGSGTTGSPYIVTGTEIDGSITNEIQDASEVNLNTAIDIDGDGTDETTVQEAIEKLNTGSTDNQIIDGLSINDGKISVSLEDDGVIPNELDLISGNINNNIGYGTDGGLYLNVSSVTISETITNLTEEGDGTFKYVNENGVSQIINKSNLTDLGNGTFTFNNGDGTPISFIGTDNQDATEVNLNTAIDIDGDGTDETTVQEAIEKLNTGSTDNQDLSISGNVLSLTGDGTTVTLPTADGSETVVNGGGINVVSGSGTTGSPYIVTGTEIDGSITNEIQTITAGTGISVTPTGINYQITNTAPDQTVVITGAGSTGVTGTYPNFTVTSTDNQTASQVNLDTPIDVDGDGTTETTVEDVIQDIAAITSKSARIFYPPSIEIDASTVGTGTPVNLYTQYTSQYATPAVASTGAPSAIPTYTAAELYYYVTYYDTAVFANVSVNAAGLMTYDIIATPTSYNSLINVVFVVK